MAEAYGQAAARLSQRMDERQKLVQFPMTPQGRVLLRQEISRGCVISGRNFDAEIEILEMIGGNKHGCA